MSDLEGTIQATARLAVGRMPFVRLFRNNRGKAWIGKVLKKEGRIITLQSSSGYPVEFGLTEGASDLIGLTRVTITPDMVGKTVAVFTAGECKRPGITVPEHQQNFINFVRSFGGLAGVVRSPEDAVRLVTEGVGR